MLVGLAVAGPHRHPPTTAPTPAPGAPEVPQPAAPTCSPLELLVTAGPVAGLGHRAVVVTVTTCGAVPREVTGYAGGEGSAVTGVSWSATVTDGTLTGGQALRVVPVPCDPGQVLSMWVDAGTTGELEVAAWAREPAR